MFSLKHLFPSGPKSFPTLAQKHFNGSAAWILRAFTGFTARVLLSLVCMVFDENNKFKPRKE